MLDEEVITEAGTLERKEKDMIPLAQKLKIYNKSEKDKNEKKDKESVKIMIIRS